MSKPIMIDQQKIDEWRLETERCQMTSALWEYCPDEFRWLLDAYEKTLLHITNLENIMLSITKLDAKNNRWKLVPFEPTGDMVIAGFESAPTKFFSETDEWEKYEAMSGCQQAAHRAKLCWAAMIAASSQLPEGRAPCINLPRPIASTSEKCLSDVFPCASIHESSVLYPPGVKEIDLYGRDELIGAVHSVGGSVVGA